MRSLFTLVLVLGAPGCWVDDAGVCHLQPSQYSVQTFEQTCNGVTTTYTSRGCNFDEDWNPQTECENACATKATCRKISSSLAGGTCSATVCGG
jgi:hypothetical protein